MGYTTSFTGHIGLSRKLTIAEARQLLEINEDIDLIDEGEHPVRGYMQWVPSESLDAIVWDGNEKFYDYEAWLNWIVKWLAARGVSSSGRLHWRGESAGDMGVITVNNGTVVLEAVGSAVKVNHNPLTLDSLARRALNEVTAKSVI